MRVLKKCIIRIVSIISWGLLWPCAIMYFFSKNREDIYRDIMANMKFRSAKLTGVSAVLYVLLQDRYYRTLFYYRVGYISLLIRWLWHGDNSFSISCPNIGGGMFCIHPTSTYLNAKFIGENFHCRQNTTIGNKEDIRPNERPSIGDNVKVGANVVIIGNITIGDNVVIGAGSVVVKDIPNNAIVVGNPARVIKYNNK